eukprot:Plantae.Rhodophyta-Purpureofilum_apyrenoidigerum.ctg22235.p3 GENE.Plantae.Rhodophyta-Purpureofilum_apyrenoidigerum.ctg22235~~Plantae.Rhodophyta-Purpureofilum_apyrenoidigerum.ctg22235.p3  ORF type:complete len:107 (-),score=4.70 Plantae.Rhodophyta-Purpureofilum_apyrenoidigerum.ctg22235:1231-1551(-)
MNLALADHFEIWPNTEDHCKYSKAVHGKHEHTKFALVCDRDSQRLVGFAEVSALPRRTARNPLSENRRCNNLPFSSRLQVYTADETIFRLAYNRYFVQAVRLKGRA